MKKITITIYEKVKRKRALEKNEKGLFFTTKKIEKFNLLYSKYVRLNRLEKEIEFFFTFFVFLLFSI